MGSSLEILNHCLVNVSERPVTTYASTHPSAISARVVIEGLVKEVQTEGWWFNTEYDVLLSANILGEVILPADVLKVTPKYPDQYLVRRRGKLYDPINHTYILSRDVTADIILELDVEDLPDTAFNYIKHCSAWRFFAGDDGDANSINAVALKDDLAMAGAKFKAENLKESLTNSNNRPAALQLHSRIGQYGIPTNPNVPGGR